MGWAASVAPSRYCTIAPSRYHGSMKALPVVVLGLKGGGGKSTLVIHLAVCSKRRFYSLTPIRKRQHRRMVRSDPRLQNSPRPPLSIVQLHSRRRAVTLLHYRAISLSWQHESGAGGGGAGTQGRQR